MHAASPAIETKDYAIIGKLYARENAGHALQLLEGLRNSQARAFDTDLGHLNYYFVLFCEHYGLNVKEYLRPLHVAEKVDRRRLFIGAMIRMYMPHLLTHDVEFRTGFGEGLRIVLNCDSGNLSKELDLCVAWMKTNYQEFMNQVQETAEWLTDARLMSGTLFDAA